MESESQHRVQATDKINWEEERMQRETKQKERNGIESGKREERKKIKNGTFLITTCGGKESNLEIDSTIKTILNHLSWIATLVSTCYVKARSPNPRKS